MSNISEYLQRIRDAVYGEEVRYSIHDALQVMSNDIATEDAAINEKVGQALAQQPEVLQAVIQHLDTSVEQYSIYFTQSALDAGFTGNLHMTVHNGWGLVQGYVNLSTAYTPAGQTIGVLDSSCPYKPTYNFNFSQVYWWADVSKVDRFLGCTKTEIYESGAVAIANHYWAGPIDPDGNQFVCVYLLTPLVPKS